MSSSDDANLIIPRLWLGNARASMDEDFIRHNNIVVVFNCTKNLPFSPMIPIKYRIPVDDNLEEDEIRNMELWSAEIAYKIITEYIEGKTILIHCMAGMQRSAASVAFFLIAYSKMRALDAMKFIKEKRMVAFIREPILDAQLIILTGDITERFYPMYKNYPIALKTE